MNYASRWVRLTGCGWAAAAIVMAVLLWPGSASGQIYDSGGQPSEKKKAPKAEEPKDRKKKLDPTGVFTPAPKQSGDNDGVQSNAAWSIVLVVFRGEDQAELALQALGKVRTEGQLPDAYLEKRGASTAVAYGRFDRPDSPEATRELKRIQELKIAGQQPFQFALLSPPVDKPVEGGIPEYNLVRAKALFGSSALYSLQVGVYGDRTQSRPSEEDLAVTRKAAEQAVIKLRQEGEMAFYYHSPRLSMVTIGVFDEQDYDPQVPSYKSPRLQEVQRRHPYNLYNGAGLAESRPGRRKDVPVEQRLQQSTLVKIPDK